MTGRKKPPDPAEVLLLAKALALVADTEEGRVIRWLLDRMSIGSACRCPVWILHMPNCTRSHTATSPPCDCGTGGMQEDGIPHESFCSTYSTWAEVLDDAARWRDHEEETVRRQQTKALAAQAAIDFDAFCEALPKPTTTKPSETESPFITADEEQP